MSSAKYKRGMKWGFHFSVEKTKFIIFSKKRTRVENEVKLFGSNLERVEKFLRVYFDTRLTWKEHVRQMEGKCKKVINVMRCLAGVEWEADIASLRSIYLAFFRSRLDYGSVVYRSAAKTEKVCAIQVEARRNAA